MAINKFYKDLHKVGRLSSRRLEDLTAKGYVTFCKNIFKSAMIFAGSWQLKNLSTTMLSSVSLIPNSKSLFVSMKFSKTSVQTTVVLGTRTIIPLNLFTNSEF